MENYCHLDREQLGFYKKVNNKNREQKEGCSCNLILQETKNSNLFDKNGSYSRERQMLHPT